MDDLRTLVRDEMARAGSPSYSFNDLDRRRDRERRNKRIVAGVVGIAVFVAAVWIVTPVGSLDRTETPAVPGPAETGPAETGPAETGPAETGPAETAPPPGLGTCSDGAGSRLERTNVGDRIKVRFEVYRSPGARSWRIELRQQTNPLAHWPSAVVIFEGTRVASESGDLVVQRRVPAHGFDEFRARAVDTQTGQVCKIPRRGFYCQPDESCWDNKDLR
jgi:hypothetical protein